MKHILVIDDEYPIRKLLRKLLEKEGYEVSDAVNGRHGLQLHREKPADLVIIDIIMPEKEGIETIRDFQRDYPETEIIAISGGGRISPEIYLDIVKKMGLKYTFAKPVNNEELLKTVRELLK